ncbi:hypothetical protein ES705_08960 [subsurface metagenome]
MKQTYIILCFLIISFTAQAQRIYYVSAGVDGNDSNNGTTKETPWRTLAHAEATATTAGDTIALKKGDTWSEDNILEITHGGTDTLNPILWDGSLWGSGDKATIQSTRDGGVSPYWRNIVRFAACSYVTFQNIIVDGNSKNRYGVVIGGSHTYDGPTVQNNEHDIIFQDCVIKNIGDGTAYQFGILLRPFKTNVSNITVRRNIITNIGAHCIALYPTRGMYLDGDPEAEVHNCYIGYNTLSHYRTYMGNTGNGTIITRRVRDIMYEHNTITDSHGTNDCVVITSEQGPGFYPTGITVRYNKVYAKSSKGISTYGGQPMTIDIYGNTVHHDGSLSGGRAININTGYDYTGAHFNVYFNTIYVEGDARGFYDGSNIAGTVNFENNVIYNTGTGLCSHILTVGSTIHNNNLYHNSNAGNPAYVKDGNFYKYKSNISTWEPTGAVGDPLLENLAAYDWHLQDSISPAYKNGVLIPGITEDIDDEPMVDPPSMGCYQTIAGNHPPKYLSSVIEDAFPDILEITYNMDLDNDTIPDPSAFNVQVNSVSRTVNSVAISGTKVQLTLDSTIVYGDIVTVAYTQPDSNQLQSTTGGMVENMNAQPTTNNVLTNSPIYFFSVVEDASPTILEITYDKTLDNLVVPPNSAFNVQVNSVRKIVNSIEIIGVKTLLTLASPVVNGDIVTVAYTKPASNPLQSPSGDEVFSMIAQSVNNNCLSGGYAIPPVYVSSVIDDATPALLAITYDTDLDNDSVPVPSAFNVLVNSVSRSVNTVAITGTNVHLTLDSAAVFGDTVTVAYNLPGSEQLQSTSGGIAASLNAQIVTNYVNEISPDNPNYLSSAVEDTTPTILTMTYDIDLDNDSVPAAAAFDVQVFYSPMTVNSVSIVSNMAHLELASPIVYGDIITIAYIKPPGTKIQSTLGGEASSISSQSVTNNVKAVIVDPTYISSVIENSTPKILEMTFDISLDNDSVPAPSAFDVQVNGSGGTVDSVAISGTNVRLTLDSLIVYNDIVTVSYNKPPSKPLQTAAGGQAASFNAQSVINNVEAIISNKRPVLGVSYDSSSYSGFVYEIDASGSYDLDNDPLIYSWTAPDNVSISSTDNATIEYLSPIVSEAETVEFNLSVSDGYSNQSIIIPIQILPYKPELSLAEINNIIESEYEEPNYPDNIIDDNIETRWSALGTNQWLIFELEEPFRVNHLMIYFLTGQRRLSYFDIYASKDSIFWEPILIQASSCNFSGDFQVFDFPETISDTAFSFIKLVGLGNSQDDWNSYSEIKIFGIPFAEELEINIYPNPTNEIINIVVIYPPIDSLEDPPIDIQILRIFNISGSIVYEEFVEPGIRYIQIPVDFAPGIYGVQMVSGKLVSAVKKLIVTN